MNKPIHKQFCLNINKSSRVKCCRHKRNTFNVKYTKKKKERTALRYQGFYKKKYSNSKTRVGMGGSIRIERKEKEKKKKKQEKGR